MEIQFGNNTWLSYNRKLACAISNYIIPLHFYMCMWCRQWCGGSEGISPFTYSFKDKNQEQQYREQRDEQYPWYVVASNIVYVMMFCIQLIYLPRRVFCNKSNRMHHARDWILKWLSCWWCLSSNIRLFINLYKIITYKNIRIYYLIRIKLLVFTCNLNLTNLN